MTAPSNRVLFWAFIAFCAALTITPFVINAQSVGGGPDAVGCAQMPALTGGVTSTGCGTTLQSGAGLIGVRTFCASGCTDTPGTYTPTAGTNSIVVEAQGQGGGGGGCPLASILQNCAAQPGSGGSYAKVRYTSGFSGATITAANAGQGGASGGGGVSGSPAVFTGSGISTSCPGGVAGAAGNLISSTLAGITAPVLGPNACTIVGGQILANFGGQHANPGLSMGILGTVFSGQAGGAPYGTGAISRSTVGAGATASGYGSGGGAATAANSGAVAGGDPGSSFLAVWEWR